MSLKGSSVLTRDKDHNDDDSDSGHNDYGDDNTNDDDSDSGHNDYGDDNTNGDDGYESKLQGNQTVWLTEAFATCVLKGGYR